jgi:4-diphosphocytidyl-2-C-methyl-D-erythritol kinase
MIVFPNCKINLGLQILNKREDGYHNLATVFHPVAWHDLLEVVRKENDQPADIDFSATGLPVSGDPATNLCVKAYRLLKNDFPTLPPVQLHLHKIIPMGAGLGGGSADGAFTLGLLNELFQLNLSREQQIGYALQLGSDCPFFIDNKPCYATGRGEVLEPVELQLNNYHLLIVNPGIHVNTGWAFSQLNLQELNATPRPDLRQVVQQPVATWKDHLSNDFEGPVFLAHPEVAALKDQLYAAGAIYAGMSGSGSTVFGIFGTVIQSQLSLPPAYVTKWIPAS